MSVYSHDAEQLRVIVGLQRRNSCVSSEWPCSSFQKVALLAKVLSCVQWRTCGDAVMRWCGDADYSQPRKLANVRRSATWACSENSPYLTSQERCFSEWAQEGAQSPWTEACCLALCYSSVAERQTGPTWDDMRGLGLCRFSLTARVVVTISLTKVWESSTGAFDEQQVKSVAFD